MDRNFSQIGAYHVQGGALDADWARKARGYAVRMLSQSLARLWTAGFAMLRARHFVASVPAEGSSHLDRDEVANARRVLLGEP